MNISDEVPHYDYIQYDFCKMHMNYVLHLLDNVAIIL